MKSIRFKNDYGYSRAGDVIAEGDGVAQLLILRGIAEEVSPEEAAQGETLPVACQPVITRRIPGPRETNRGTRSFQRGK